MVRPIAPTDAEGLGALYESLDIDDRQRRFFSGFHPGSPFLRKMTGVAERGGAGLVAELQDTPGRPGQIVGEATFEQLEDGDGELGITVDRDWRGWLGPYLLDALLETAAARGVPNLEADVLVTNGPMLALAHARGAVDLEQPDWTQVRILIGTGADSPTWPGDHDRARVLVEGGGGGWNARRAAGTGGIDVVACPGPGRRRGPCPAMDGRPCPLAAGADVIVTPAAIDEPWSALVDAHRRLHAGVPVCIAPRHVGPRGGRVGPAPPPLDRRCSTRQELTAHRVACTLRTDRRRSWWRTTASSTNAALRQSAANAPACSSVHP